MKFMSMRTKKILLTITLLSFAVLHHAIAQTPKNNIGGKNILKVGCGEYFTSYVTDENKIYGTLWNGATNSNQFMPFPLSNIVDVDGAQYTNICRSSSGDVYVIRKALVGGGPSVTNYPTDAYGKPFTGNLKAYGWFKSYLTIKNDGVYYFGEDQLNINGGVAITAPIRLNPPPGRQVVKLVVQDITADITALITIMCSDGTVWQYNRGSATPVQISLPAPAIDITSIGRACYVVETATDLLAWGPYAAYLGLPNNTTKPTSFLSKWTAVGLTWPVKQILGNWNTLHIIDANNNLFGAGDNMEGEVGNGVMFSNWKNYVYAGSASPYAWSWIKFSLMQTPVQIPGKFANLCSSNSIAFYFYVQDNCMGNWYSWGRNKEYALANGLRITNDDIYADWRCVPAPTLVYPSTQVWPADALFDPNANQAPNANAGVGQCVAINNANLSAAMSYQDGGTISSYAWTQVGGPAGATFATPGSVNTTVSGLVTGVYTFRVTVKNNYGLTSTDDVNINVNATSKTPPVANAGGNQTISLPANTVTLSGGGTEAGGTIASFLWTKVSGPSQSTIVSSGTASTAINNLVQGVYTFQLTVTDNSGATGTSSVTVTVNAPANVSGGPTVYLPVPGIIQAESYASMSGVQTEGTADVNGGLDVGWIDPTDWMDYNVNVASAGTYTLSLRIATPNSTGALQVKNAAGAILASVNVPATGGYQAWQTIKVPISLPAGNQTLQVYSSGSSIWNINWMDFELDTTTSGNPLPIPGIVQAENFASMSGVQTEPTNDANGGLDVGWIDPKDWMNYNVNVASAGSYTLSLRIATPNSSGALQVKDASGAILASVNVPVTGGYQTWQTVTVPISLLAGNQTLQVYSSGSSIWNINWMDFEQTATTSGNSLAIPGMVQAENFASMSGVQTEPTNDANGGLDVGWISQGDWMDYNVNVAAAGTYTVAFRLSTELPGGVLQLRNTSGTVLTTVNVPNTGNWQIWETVSASVSLPAGAQTLQLYDVGAVSWDINWMNFTSGTAQGMAQPGTEASAQALSLPSAGLVSPSLLLYPNPAADNITLNINNDHTGNMTVQVVNVSGQMVKAYQLSKDGQSSVTSLNIAGLPAGIYFIHIQIGAWIEVKKLMKL
jgi:hypothetical protein